MKMKSLIIQDLLKPNCDIESILLRLKTILRELEDESLNEWIDSELLGYEENSKIIPSYRKINGINVSVEVEDVLLITDGVPVNNTHLIENFPIDIELLSKEDQYMFSNYIVREPVFCFSHMEDYKVRYSQELVENLEKTITEIYKRINLTTIGNKKERTLNSCFGIIPIAKIKLILTKTKMILLDILLKLEEDYEILDFYDIKNKKEKTKNEIIQYIHQQINNDVTIGENAKVYASNLGVK